MHAILLNLGIKKGKETVASELHNVSPYDRAVS